MGSDGSALARRGLVLGSGGVLGFAWLLGALSALEDVTGHDTRERAVVVGTSAGSVAAALVACGLPLDAIVRHHQGTPAADDPAIGYDYGSGVGGALPPRPAWRPSAPRAAWQMVRHPHEAAPLAVLSGLLPPGRGSLTPIHALVEEVAVRCGHGDTWPATPRPWIVAAAQRTGRRVVFGRDESPAASLADAVQASCSIPAWYPPMVIDGEPYVDGGAASVSSIDLMLDAGVDEVDVLVPMASVAPDHPRTPAARVERRLRRMITRRTLADVARVRSAGIEVRLVTPGPDDLAAMGANMMNPGPRLAVLETARRTAAGQLRSARLAGAR